MENRDIATKLDEILKKVNESNAEIMEIKQKVEKVEQNQQVLTEKVKQMEKSDRNASGLVNLNGFQSFHNEISTELEKILKSIKNSDDFLRMSVDNQEKYMKKKADEFIEDAKKAEQHAEKMDEQNKKIAKTVENCLGKIEERLNEKSKELNRDIELFMKNSITIKLENEKIAHRIQDCLRRFQEKLEKTDLTTNSDQRRAHRCNKCTLLLLESPADDGVSVQCSNPNCREWNIVGELQSGNRWVAISGCWHVQQLSIKTKLRETVNCGICGKIGETFNGGKEARVDHEAKTVNLTINSTNGRTE